MLLRTPVLVASTFDDAEEAAGVTNGTDYGLIAAVWTRNVGRAHKLAAELRAGQVYVNTYGAGRGVELPFGGYKRSSHGREKGYEALREYSRLKTQLLARLRQEGVPGRPPRRGVSRTRQAART